MSNPFTEQVVQFGAGRSLVGIFTSPAVKPPLARPAVVLLNAGMLHRVGPNRIYVQIARALACAGFNVLRFDFSGLGDSKPRADHMPYAQSAPSEAAAAMQWLTEMQGAQHFLLMGHCAGAAFSLLVASTDARVAGAVLINMEGGDEQWTEYDRMKKVSRQYMRDYGGSLLDRERWAKLMSGRADYRSIARNIFKDTLWYRIKGYAFQTQKSLRGRQDAGHAEQEARAQQYLQPIAARNGRLLLVHSEGSTGLVRMRANFGNALVQLQHEGIMELVIIAQCDHLFMLLDRQQQLSAVITDWANQHFAVAPPAEPTTPLNLPPQRA